MTDVMHNKSYERKNAREGGSHTRVFVFLTSHTKHKRIKQKETFLTSHISSVRFLRHILTGFC